MKKSVKIILALVLAAIIGAGGFVIYKNSQGISYDISSVEKVQNDVEIVSETEDGVTIKKNSDGDFKVLMFTDTHLNGKKAKDKHQRKYKSNDFFVHHFPPVKRLFFLEIILARALIINNSVITQTNIMADSALILGLIPTLAIE